MLTELGELVLPRVKDILRGVDSLTQDLNENAGVPKGQVRIAMLATLAKPLVTRLFYEVREKHPQIQLRVIGASVGRMDAWLAEGSIDMAVLFRYGRAEVASETPLGVVDTYLVSAPNDPLTSQPTVKFAALDKLPLVLPAPPNGLRVVLDQITKKLKIDLNVVMDTNSLAVYEDIVAMGRGIYTVLPGYALARGVKAGELQASRIVEPDIERYVTLAVAPRPASLAAREVARMLRRTIEETADLLGMRPL